jgi:hypothetical protein
LQKKLQNVENHLLIQNLYRGVFSVLLIYVQLKSKQSQTPVYRKTIEGKQKIYPNIFLVSCSPSIWNLFSIL